MEAEGTNMAQDGLGPSAGVARATFALAMELKGAQYTRLRYPICSSLRIDLVIFEDKVEG